MTAVYETEFKSAAGFSTAADKENRQPLVMVPFEWSVLRYAHDPAAGEALNFGIVVYSRDTGFLRTLVQDATKRLSCAFPAFDVEQHKRVVSRFEKAIEFQAKQITDAVSPNTFPFFEAPHSLDAVLKSIWQDKGLSYQVDTASVGVSDDLQASVESLFNRFVRSRWEEPARNRRNDEDLWASTYRKALRNFHVTEHLEPRVIRVDGFEFNFPHTFKNGDFHILEPVSFDYEKTAKIRDRVVELVGQALTLQEADDQNRLYLLLGKPRSPEMAASYRTAVSSLRKRLRGQCEIYEEEEAEELGGRIASIMQHAGILEK